MLARFRQRIHELGRLLLTANLLPRQVAVAVFIGCIVGCSPLFGLHFVICAGVAWLFRLNLPITYAAAHLSVPPLIPVLGWSSVELGERILRGHWVTLSRTEFTREAVPALAHRFFIAWLCGGFVLGASIGLVAGGLAYIVLSRRKTAGAATSLALAEPTASMPTSAVAKALAAAASRYATAPRKYRYYARAKYRMDPCYRAICERTPPGAFVLDLGCGLGMLPVALGELGEGRGAHGIDWDAEKIAVGKVAAAGLMGVSIERGDVRSAALPPCDRVTLVDVLHYYDAATQREVLARAATALRPGGRVLIRETDPEKVGGARLTRFFERMMVRFGWNRGPAVTYRPIAELLADLRSVGLRVSEGQAEVAGATHPGNVLIEAERPAPASLAVAPEAGAPPDSAQTN